MNPRRDQVERDYGHLREQVFDESLSASSLRGASGPVNPMQQFGSRYGGNGDLLARMLSQQGVQVELTAFGSDQDAGINQRRHGDLGSLG